MPRVVFRFLYIVLAVLITVVALVFITLSATAVATDKQPPNRQQPSPMFVSRIYYQNYADIEKLTAYDLLEFNNQDDRYLLALVDKDGYNRLQKAGWRVAIDEPATADIQSLKQQQLLFDEYRTVAELYADLQLISNATPTLTELVDYGDSYCQTQGGCTTLGGDTQPGHDLFALRISNETISGTSVISGSTIISGSKPVFFLLANIHGREISTPELAMRLIDWLVDGYGTDPEATWLVDWHEIWVVPTANPDGHWLVELGTQPPYNGSPFSHRKNANNDADDDLIIDCTTWPPQSYDFGVDLNRNHSHGWGGSGASNTPCDALYHGPSAASEVETQYLQALLAALLSDQRGADPTDAAPPDTSGIFITMHNFSRLILWPWGYQLAASANETDLRAIGTKLATYNGYTAKQGAELYLASGTSDDWVYGELGVPAFTFEIGTQFFAPYSEIDALQWPNNGPALKYAAKIARTPYQTIHGPDLFQPEITVAGPTTLALTAVADDTLNGGQTISQTEFYLDNPLWNGGQPQGMDAFDGTFDTAVETISGTFDIGELGNGRHLLFIRGQDNEGNWGPFNAKFIDIPLPLDTIGPSITDLQISPFAQYTETVTANLSDIDSGNAHIAQAELYIDLLPGNGGIAQPMGATDDNFDQLEESVIGTINTSDLSNGQHIVYVRGQDIWGNWGPFAQQLLTIDYNTACAITTGGTYTLGITTPITITIFQAGPLHCLTASTHIQPHPQAIANIGYDRYWTINGTNNSGNAIVNGFSLTVTLPYSATPDTVDGGCRHAGGGPYWTCKAVVFDGNQGMVTLPGVTLMGDWAIGNDLDTVPTAVTPDIVTVGNNSILIFWSDHTANNCEYEIHYNNQPYFTPDGYQTWLADITDLSNVPIEYFIPFAIGDSMTNYTFLIRAVHCSIPPTLVADSTHIGEFDFALQPGSQ